MYSDKKSVLQLTALVKAHNIRHIILCPGSRNAPLIHSFATDTDFTCHSITDERSAAFFALGIIQATGKPAAVCCTSGTAALNLGPAIAEAFYQELPLLVITADRPAAWIGQMDGQTLPQGNLYGSLARHSVQLPEVNTKEEEWYCNRLINEAILALNKNVKGPSHINIPLSEPLFEFNTPSLPPVRVIRQPQQIPVCFEATTYANRFMHYSRRMIIVGQLPPGNNLTEWLDMLRGKAGVVVLNEQLSNLPANKLSSFDTALYSASEKEKEKLAPELVITIGGHIVSKRLKQFIRECPLSEHWHISSDGKVTDTFQQVTEIIQSDYSSFLKYLANTVIHQTNSSKGRSPEIREQQQNYLALWEKHCASIPRPEAGFSSLSAIGEVISHLPAKSTLQIGNSNSVRFAQLFPLPSSAHVFCNRGTNGIEGSLSTAVGYSTLSERLTVLLVGDLSFFYDMNVLRHTPIGSNLRILLNNNGGGGIFSLLGGLNRSAAMGKYITATHQTNAEAWARQQGFIYLPVHNTKDLQEQIPQFLSPDNEQPAIMEVFTTAQQDSEQIRQYYHLLS